MHARQIDVGNEPALPRVVTPRIRNAHETWCALLIEVRRAARELASLGDDTQSDALLADAEHFERRARRHLRRLLREAANDGG